MDKISYETRYKFIVSIGVVLTILPFGVLYSIIALSKDIIISKRKLMSWMGYQNILLKNWKIIFYIN